MNASEKRRTQELSCHYYLKTLYVFTILSFKALNGPLRYISASITLYHPYIFYDTSLKFPVILFRSTMHRTLSSLSLPLGLFPINLFFRNPFFNTNPLLARRYPPIPPSFLPWNVYSTYFIVTTGYIKKCFFTRLVRSVFLFRRNNFLQHMCCYICLYLFAINIYEERAFYVSCKWSFTVHVYLFCKG